jgi:murein L,D-transpeptidase YcbB/YkuD
MASGKTSVGRWIGCVVVVICLVSAAAAQAAAPLLWVRNGTATPQAQELRRVLGEAERFGLSSASYRSELTDAQLRLVHEGGADAELLQRYDRDLTRLASRFTSHLRYGRVKPRSAGFDLPASAASMTDAVAQLADSENVEATLAALEPAPLPYRMLKQALARYRQLAKDESFEPLPALPGRSLRAGDSYAGAPWLRQRLALLGDLPADADPEPTDVLDETLVEGLKSFQSRHGLAADGILGKQTLAALNVPLRKRVQQIELSMERWRWLSEMPRPDIVVDVPHFMLHALPRPDRPGEQMLEMPVIVGRTRDRTPVFFASIDQVVFNPYWDVPTSILRNELLPKIRKDVDYLRRNHFEIVQGGDNGVVHAPTPEAIAALAEGRFRLRQRPGPDNALGPVKFIMSNPYGIRLHGTPEPDLFRFPQRTFSHGCIRVSDPAALAEYVLANADGEWDSTAVENAMCGTEPRRVVLRTPVRVLVFYATAAATRSRGVLFAPDVYGLDARLLKLLAALPAS